MFTSPVYLWLAQTTTEATQKAHGGIMETFTKWSTDFIDYLGYLGAFILMALESMIAPVPSEAVMPFVGFNVAKGSMNLYLAVLITSAGTLFGSLLSYYLGYFGGKPLVMRVGRFFLINESHLDWTINFFHKRGGSWTVFVCRFIPVVRHFISIPAGIGKMPLLKFCIVTTIGGTIWNGFLLYVGMKWYKHMDDLKKYYKVLDVVVIVLGVIAVALWFYLHLRKKKPANKPVESRVE